MYVRVLSHRKSGGEEKLAGYCGEGGGRDGKKST